MPSSTKWRLYFPWGAPVIVHNSSQVPGAFPEQYGTTNVTNDTHLEPGLYIGEITMAGYVGGPNLCGGGTATALRSGSHAGHAVLPDKAFDGVFPVNDDEPAPGQPLEYWWPTYALHTYDQPNWIEYEFAAPVAVVEYGISNCNESFRDPISGELDLGWVWELQYFDSDADTWVTVDRRDFEKMRNFVNYFTVPGTVSPTRINQIAVEVLRSNGSSIFTRTNQIVVEVLRSNGVEAGGDAIDPTPGQNPAFSTWFMMF